LLSDEGLTNHPLDYNPITNEHTAAMTLAKQSGIEAYNAGRCGCVDCTEMSQAVWTVQRCLRLCGLYRDVSGCVDCTEMSQACHGRARRICARLLNKLLLH
jgi:hypothetical protein